MKYEGRVTISRDSRDMINIKLKDNSSRLNITEISLSLENYALLITGLSEVECMHETTTDVSNVGKTKVIENRSIQAPCLGYSKDVYEEWLEKNGQEDGWELNLYLSSQRSIVHKDDEVTLNYTVYRYE